MQIPHSWQDMSVNQWKQISSNSSLCALSFLLSFSLFFYSCWFKQDCSGVKDLELSVCRIKYKGDCKVGSSSHVRLFSYYSSRLERDLALGVLARILGFDLWKAVLFCSMKNFMYIFIQVVGLLTFYWFTSKVLGDNWLIPDIVNWVNSPLNYTSFIINESLCLVFGYLAFVVPYQDTTKKSVAK